MFHLKDNASKVAFYYLNKYLLDNNYDLIDCQFVNDHLFIVIFLAILIICCFFALIYGMYSKISNNQNNIENYSYIHSLNLSQNEKIIDIEAIDENSILFIVSDSKNTYAIVFDIKNNVIKSQIKR